MVRLRKLSISGFRGARYPLTLDLSGSCKSIAIFGENASGKSTITDGIEWFFKDKVEHLWREECKEEALRNVFLDGNGDALVGLDFSNKSLSCDKLLTEALSVKESNKDPAFKSYKAKAAGERLVLRTAYLTEFINKRKAEKRKEVAEIIGYEALNEFRRVILAVQNALEKYPEYIYSRKNEVTQQAKLMELVGEVLINEEKLFEKANELVKRFGPPQEITDNESYLQCVADLKRKITQQEKVEKRLKLGELKKACELLRSAIESTKESENNFIGPYARLIKSKEKIRLLDLEQFLSKGKEILDEGLTEANICPFCKSQVDLDHVKEEVTRRVQELESIRKEFQATRSTKEQWLSDLREVNRLAGELEGRWSGLNISPELAELVRNFKGNAVNLKSLVEENFKHYEQIPEDPKRSETAKQLVFSLEERMEKVNEEVKELEFNQEETEIIETIQILSDLKAAFSEYRQSTKTKEVFERQIKTLIGVKDGFIKVQNQAFQNVLDIMTENISKYYLFLPPPKNENVDDVKLRIVGEEGIEFEYSFYGKKTHPPMKYLSESHLNSLGVALFLASVKLFNKESNFFVLDDVVTSFDTGHRLRLLRLLEEEFKDWQILLLTHERHWFEMIKKELAPLGWILSQVDWDHENGVQLSGVPEDLRKLISLKRSQGHDVENDLRTLLEKILKEICFDLQVKMAFCYNDRNEERMVGELLSELRRTLNEKAPVLKDHPILKQIDTSNLLGTMGSHDSPKETSKGDIDVALEDIEKLEALFRCEQCKHLVSRQHFIKSEKKITCKCGAKGIDWKG